MMKDSKLTHTTPDIAQPDTNETNYDDDHCIDSDEDDGYPIKHKYSKTVRYNNLESHQFLSLIKDITLIDNSLQAISCFYQKL